MRHLNHWAVLVTITVIVTLGCVYGYVLVHELYQDKLHEQFLLGVSDGYDMYEHEIGVNADEWALEEFNRIWVEHPELVSSSCN